MSVFVFSFDACLVRNIFFYLWCDKFEDEILTRPLWVIKELRKKTICYTLFLKCSSLKINVRLTFSISYSFCHWAYLISKKSFKNCRRLYLGQMNSRKLHLHLQWSPETHTNPHKRVAVQTATWPLFILKNHYRNFWKAINS